ncbi:MAG: hypothetical protein JSR73_14050 [Proteobacteria bacterium]|nr:hypothetical protein [Pseudomonadota bacterium]
MRMLVLAAALALGGCVSVPLNEHQATLATIVGLRDGCTQSLAVGDFKAAAALPPADDREVSVRGSTVKPPTGATFSQYLRDSLIRDLKAAGRYSESAPVVVSGELVQNELHGASFSTGTTAVAARFVVMRGGETLLDKVLRDEDQWKSSFMGAVAIPAAINHYTDEFPRLLGHLYVDPDFRKACGAPAG